MTPSRIDPPASLAQAIAELPAYNPAALPVADACALIARTLAPVQAVERLPIRDCLGRVLAHDIDSPIDVPAHDNSAMDGYALRHADLAADAPTRLRVIGAAYAGKPFAQAVGAGEAVRIMTGAVMPAGADTVVPQESLRAEGDAIIVPAGQQFGQNRRLAGEDLARGRAALRAGRILGAADLGLIASLGIAEAPVRRRLRVACLSTGDEIASLGEALGPGQVYDSNRYTLHGMLTRLGVQVIDLGVVRDDPALLEAAIAQAADCADAVISSGGVSVGEADFTRDIMARLGEVAFWTIAMRPGRPLAFGRIGNARYFGLPGNPVAVMITFLFFARPALLRLMGASAADPMPVLARVEERLRKRPGRTEYQRAQVRVAADGELVVRTTGSQGSGVLRSMSEANAIMVLGHEQGDVQPGDRVSCLLFEGLL
jgi:molybdopterin molybdotransferase